MTVPAAGVTDSWPSLGCMLTAVGPNQKSSQALIKHRLTEPAGWWWWGLHRAVLTENPGFIFLSLVFVFPFSAERGNEITEWGLGWNCFCLVAKVAGHLSTAPPVMRKVLSHQAHTYTPHFYSMNINVIWSPCDGWIKACVCCLSALFQRPIIICDPSVKHHF